VIKGFGYVLRSQVAGILREKVAVYATDRSQIGLTRDYIRALR
jgi:hypothetical protein